MAKSGVIRRELSRLVVLELVRPHPLRQDTAGNFGVLPSLILVFGLVGFLFCGDGLRNGWWLDGMVVWGFDQASTTSLLGRRRPGGSSPAA